MDILLVLSMIILSAFFSGVEIAYFSANRLKIELKNKQGEVSAKILSGFLHKPGHFITTLLIGNNMALVIYGISLTVILDPVLKEILPLQLANSELFMLLIQTLISTLIILLFGEFIPKAVFRRDPDRMIQFTAYPMLLFSTLLYPISKAVSALSYGMMRYVFGIKSVQEGLVFGRTDLDHFIKDTLYNEKAGSNEGNPDIDAEAFNKALDFNKTRVRDIMVPRIDIEALPISSTMEDILNKFIETGLSRIVVYEETLDQVKGTIHSIELFRRPATVEEIIQPVLIVPETMPANLLLTEFTRNRKTTAIVVDEFGGTSGLVTVEDLVEEILGDIEDEHDEPGEEDLTEKEEAPGKWIFSARQPVDYLNEKYEFNLPEGDYTTLGGLVMFYAESIPSEGDTIQLDVYTFTILQADQNRLGLIRLEKQNSAS